MRDSLLSRFQGTLAGVSFGSRLTRSQKKPISPSGSSAREAFQLPKTLLNLNQYRLKWCEPNGEDEKSTSTDEENLVTQMTQSLIRCQGLQRVDWDETWQEWQQQELERKQQAHTRVREPNRRGLDVQPDSRGGCSLAEVTVATLPIALFFHDQPDQLLQQLQQGIQVWQNPSPSLALEQAVLAVSYAISLALREELDPGTLIGQILKHLDPQFILHQQLQQVQTFTEQRVSLETVRERLLLSSSELNLGHKTDQISADLKSITCIALAFYCFVSTPQEPALSVLRAAQTGLTMPMVSTITGALSGAHNGFYSFPVSWQLQLKRTASSSQAISAEPQTTQEMLFVGESLQRATELFAVWSGAYNTTNPLFETHPTLVVSAPNGIRSRQS